MIDPQRTREVFFEYTLGFLERKKINSFDPEKPMGNYALTMLSEVILGYFVNVKEEVECYLPTVHEWLDFAIERKDPFGEGDDLIFYHAELFKGKALALWMSDNINSIEYWHKAFELWCDFDQSSRTIYAKSKFKTDFLDDFLQLCIECGQHQAGIDRFEHYYGRKEISIKKKMTPREYGYVLCRNYLEPKYSSEELVEAGEKMLTKYMEEPWLRMGLYSYAAIWLKIVYWDNKKVLTPYETILKAYDSMPNIESLE